VLRRPESDQLFFVYTGARHLLMSDPLAFVRHTCLDERNLALFSDPHTSFYQRGISSTVDSFESLLAWHRDYTRELTHVRRVFCLGTSMGGYAALLFGYLLAVEEVWAFGPPTIIDARRYPCTSEDHANLRFLLLRPNGTTSYNIFYNRVFRRDRIFAQRLLGCDGVRLWPQSGEGHNVVGAMTDEQLRGLLPPPSEAAATHHR
jgi:hypothetical protein